MLIIGGLLCLISTLPLLCQSLQVVVREEKIVTKIGDNVQLICSAVSERVGCSFTSPIGKFFSLWSIFIYSRWLTFCNSLANFESRLARHRFSQKTNGRICIVYFFTFHGKQIKFVRSFFGRIYDAPICLRFFLTFRQFWWQIRGQFWKQFCGLTLATTSWTFSWTIFRQLLEIRYVLSSGIVKLQNLPSTTQTMRLKNFFSLLENFIILCFFLCFLFFSFFGGCSTTKWSLVNFLQFSWSLGTSTIPTCVYSKVSIIRPGCYRLLEFEKKIVLVV